MTNNTTDPPSLAGITRIEFIDFENGREFVRYTERPVTFSVQDEGRTLKIFSEDPDE